VGIVPNGAAGAIAVDGISVLDGVVAVLPAVDVETVGGTVEGVGTGGAAMAG
jgi:hypothetical protein